RYWCAAGKILCGVVGDRDDRISAAANHETDHRGSLRLRKRVVDMDNQRYVPMRDCRRHHEASAQRVGVDDVRPNLRDDVPELFGRSSDLLCKTQRVARLK